MKTYIFTLLPSKSFVILASHSFDNHTFAVRVIISHALDMGDNADSLSNDQAGDGEDIGSHKDELKRNCLKSEFVRVRGGCITKQTIQNFYL